MSDSEESFAPMADIFGQARNRAKGGVSRRSEPLSGFLACRIAVHRSGALNGFHISAGKHRGRLVRQRAMGPVMVVVITPARQRGACFVQRAEPFDVQTLVAQTTVETFDEPILYRSPWADET